MKKISRSNLHRLSFLGAVAGLALAMPALLRAQTPQYPQIVTKYRYICNTALWICEDCSITTGNTACQFMCPGGGTCGNWTKQACTSAPQIPSAPTCEETYFDCGTVIYCSNGYPAGGNCSNDKWCR